MSAPPPPPHLNLNLPPEQEGGVYANIVAVWHDGDGFILDFSVIVTAPQPATNQDTGQNVTLINAKVVSRVRIPASQAFELMKALNTQLSQWEAERQVNEAEE
jgi:Protein of unknown function (DUF3467)